MNQRTIIGLVSAGLGAALLVAAVFSQKWIVSVNYGMDPSSDDDIRTHIGLRSAESCFGDAECNQIDLDDYNAVKGVSRFQTIGKIVTVACACTAAMLLALLFYGLQKKTPRWPVHPGSAALILSVVVLVAGVLALALHPFRSTAYGTGPGFLLLAGGDIAALSAALILGRSEPISEDNWFE